jgi:hypothetical protein
MSDLAHDAAETAGVEFTNGDQPGVRPFQGPCRAHRRSRRSIQTVGWRESSPGPSRQYAQETIGYRLRAVSRPTIKGLEANDGPVAAAELAQKFNGGACIQRREDYRVKLVKQEPLE